MNITNEIIDKYRGKQAYISQPFTSEKPYEQIYRYGVGRAYSAYLITNDVFAYSPIVYGYSFVRGESPYIQGLLKGDYKTWEQFDKHMMSKSDLFVVLKIKGWKDSVGLNSEKESWLHGNQGTSSGVAVDITEPSIHYYEVPEEEIKVITKIMRGE